MLLVDPPVSKPSEPPPGIARLSGVLSARGVPHEVIDASVEGLLWLAGGPAGQKDKWTARAKRNLAPNLQFLRSDAGCKSPARYSRAVFDLDRAAAASAGPGFRVSLQDFDQRGLSPLRSADLVRAAEAPESNPFFGYFAPRLREAVDTGRHAAAGFSLNYLSQALTTFSMIGFLRREFPRLKIAAGGGLVTSWVRRFDLGAKFSGLVDRFVAGPGENAILELAGVEPNPRGTRAVPSYEKFPMSEYVAPGRIVPYAASTGCYFAKCRFCPERAEGNAFAPTPPGTVCDQLRLLARKYRPALIHLTDNAIAPAVLRELHRKPPGAPWYGFARIGEDLADPDFCRALEESGCAMLKLGIESGADRVLDAMQKGFDTGVSSKALRNLRDAGIAVYGYLLFGTPYESEADARLTLKFAAAHSDCITFLNLAIFNLPAGSPDAAELSTRPFYEGDLSLYSDFAHQSDWGRGKIKAFLSREFRRHGAIAPIIRRDPPIFASNHAAFFAGDCREPS